MAAPMAWRSHGPVSLDSTGKYFEITDKVGLLAHIRNRSLPLDLERLAVGALYVEVMTGPDRPDDLEQFYAKLVGAA